MNRKGNERKKSKRKRALFNKAMSIILLVTLIVPTSFITIASGKVESELDNTENVEKKELVDNADIDTPIDKDAAKDTDAATDTDAVTDMAVDTDTSAYVQNMYKISGRITDKYGPIKGAKVMVDATYEGITDEMGRYEIKVLEKPDTYSVEVISGDSKHERKISQETIKGDCALNFELGIHVFTVSSEGAQGGNISIDEPNVEYGKSRKATITAEENFVINKVYINDAEVEATFSEDKKTGTLEIENITANQVVKASFLQECSTIDIQFDSNGNVTNPEIFASLIGSENNITYPTDDKMNDAKKHVLSINKLEPSYYVASITADSNVTVNKETKNVYKFEGEAIASGYTASLTMAIDQDAPSLQELTGTKTGWQKESYSISVNVTDGKSGIDKVYCGTTEDIGSGEEMTKDEGVYSFAIPTKSYDGIYYIMAVDNVGNISTKSFDVKMDAVVPTVEKVEKMPKSDWHNDDVTVTVTASDDQSGIKAVYYTMEKEGYDKSMALTKKDDTTYQFTVDKKNIQDIFYIYAEDNCKNMSVKSEIKVQIDITNPIINKVDITSTYKDKNTGKYWGTADVKLSIEATDEDTGSGIDNVYIGTNPSKAGIPVEVEDGSYTCSIKETGKYYIWVVDKAGNRFDYKTDYDINIHTQKPAISRIEYRDLTDTTIVEHIIQGVKKFFHKDTVKVYVSASDIGPGVKEIRLIKKDGNNSVIMKDYTPVTGGENKAVFELSMKEFNEFKGKVYAQCKNYVGTESALMEKEELMMEANDPRIRITEEIPPYEVTEGDNKISCFKNDFGIKVDLKDNVCGKVNSGIMKYEVKVNDTVVYTADYSKEKPENFVVDMEKTVTFNTNNQEPIIQIDKKGAYNIEVSVTDFAGNTVTDTKKIYKDTTNPVIGGLEKEVADEWSPDTVQVYVKGVEDPEQESSYTSGVMKVMYLIEGQEIESAKEAEYDAQNDRYTFAVTDECDRTYMVWGIDNVGNKGEKSSISVKIDKTAPEIDHYKFSLANYQDSTSTKDQLKNAIEITDNGFYFKEKVMVTITADDELANAEGVKHPSAGIKWIQYYLLDKDGTKTSGAQTPDEKGRITVEVAENFKGQIYAKATDKVGNTLQDDVATEGIDEGYVHPDGTAVENAAKHQETSSVAIAVPDTIRKDKNQTKLYSADVPVDIAVVDTYSGIRTIEWSVVAPYDTNKNQSGKVEVNSNGTLAGDAGGWKVIDTDQNLVTKITKHVVVTNDSNAILVRTKLTDRAGNVTEAMEIISIDKTVPTISVVYDNNNSDPQFQSEALYFKEDRIATITVTERNFVESDILLKLENSEGGVPDVNGWVENYNQSDPNQTTYSTSIAYTSDGKYSFDIDFTDMAGNVAGDYQGDSFVMDKTIPTIQVSYSNNTSESGNYYAQQRVATVTIDEHNFETSRVQITGTATDNGETKAFPSTSGWSATGDQNSASITYSEDAAYTFDIAYTDKAGNQAGDYGQEEFVIDQTQPVLEIKGIEDKSANRGEIKPVISWSDTNLKTDPEITIEGSNTGKGTPLGNYSEIPNGGQFLFDDIPMEKKNDDIYTLKSVVTDLAGNKQEKEIRFSVNRFGSVYTFAPTLKKIQGKYIQQEEDVVITETNVDELNNETLKIKVTKDGTVSELKDRKDYKIVKQGGDGKWSQYQYTIGAEQFAEEGKYIVATSSKDKAGNINENGDEMKGAEIWFGVDKTAPIVVATNVEKNTTYPEDSKTAVIDITDNLVLDTVEITLNGNTVAAEPNNNEYSIPISGMNTKQEIIISASDAAGNEHQETIDGFYVTTNLFVRWYTNTMAVIMTIAGGIIILGGIGMVITMRHKKRRSNVGE